MQICLGVLHTGCMISRALYHLRLNLMSTIDEESDVPHDTLHLLDVYLTDNLKVVPESCLFIRKMSSSGENTPGRQAMAVMEDIRKEIIFKKPIGTPRKKHKEKVLDEDTYVEVIDFFSASECEINCGFVARGENHPT
jgi:hypothetical protein